jgi:hypothetical protein
VIRDGSDIVHEHGAINNAVIRDGSDIVHEHGAVNNAVIRDGSDIVHEHGAVNNAVIRDGSDIVHEHGAANDHRVDVCNPGHWPGLPRPPYRTRADCRLYWTGSMQREPGCIMTSA